jgi:hypothetical protein
LITVYFDGTDRTPPASAGGRSQVHTARASSIGSEWSCNQMLQSPSKYSIRTTKTYKHVHCVQCAAQRNCRLPIVLLFSVAAPGNVSRQQAAKNVFDNVRHFLSKSNQPRMLLAKSHLLECTPSRSSESKQFVRRGRFVSRAILPTLSINYFVASLIACSAVYTYTGTCRRQ